ncbi:hypothetical protein SEVIR_9G367975v4 [Setaria viridis]
MAESRSVFWRRGPRRQCGPSKTAGPTARLARRPQPGPRPPNRPAAAARLGQIWPGQSRPSVAMDGPPGVSPEQKPGAPVHPQNPRAISLPLPRVVSPWRGRLSRLRRGPPAAVERRTAAAAPPPPSLSFFPLPLSLRASSRSRDLAAEEGRRHRGSPRRRARPPEGERAAVERSCGGAIAPVRGGRAVRRGRPQVSLSASLFFLLFLFRFFIDSLSVLPDLLDENLEPLSWGTKAVGPAGVGAELAYADRYAFPIPTRVVGYRQPTYVRWL